MSMFGTFGLAALALAWCLPGHYPPWYSFEQQALAAIGACLLAAEAAREPRARVPVLAWVAFAVAAVPWLQWMTGKIVYLQDASISSLYLAGFALCVIAGATLAQRRPSAFLDGLGAAIVTAGIMSVGLALIQWLGLASSWMVANMPRGGRPFANLGQPNHLCTLLGMAVVATILAYERRQLRGPTASLAVAWFGFGMVMTQSRTGWLFVAVTVLWWAGMRRRVGLRLGPAAVLTGAAGFVAAVALWPSLNDALLLSVEPLESRLHPGTRLLHWQTLLDAAWRAPWSGYGWAQVSQAQLAAALDHPASHEWLLNSHNVAIDLLIWNGLPLGGVLIAVLVWWFVRQAGTCDSLDRWALLLATAAVFIHGLLEFPLDYTYFLFPAGLMMGAADQLRAMDKDAFPSIARLSFVSMLAVACIGLGWVSSDYLRVQSAATQLRFVMARIGVDKVSDAPPPETVLLDGLREYHRYWLKPARTGFTADELDAARDVMQRYPVPPAMLRYALMAGLNGRPDEAATTLALLCKIHSVARCREARESWSLLAAQHPQLIAIAAPIPR